MRAWIDIENPPQVQYLLPFRDAFLARGADVTVTARDYGFALDLLRDRGVPVHAVGSTFGASRWRKVTGTWRRSSGLVGVAREQGRPDFVLCSGRPAVIAARRMRIPSFVVEDYEHSHLRLYGLLRTTVLHTEAIDQDVLVSNGLRREQLVPFRGIKEDISFAGIDLDAVEPYPLPGVDERLVRVLFRPPAEQSHYYRSESLALSLATLDELARRPDVVVLFTPRAREQVAYLEGRSFAHPPVLLDRPVPFVPLLKSVDAVISSGGTMLREAAYLGVPAVSILRSDIGGVDRYLESLGRLKIVESRGRAARRSCSPRARVPRCCVRTRMSSTRSSTRCSSACRDAASVQAARGARPLSRPGGTGRAEGRCSTPRRRGR